MSSLLVIADIGGYTRFMKVHRINLAHAQDVVAQLLEAVIDGGAPLLRLAKLEGDAAFFVGDVPKEPGVLERQLKRVRQRFFDRQRQLEINRACTCDGCVQVGQLKLKFVAHAGEVAVQRVKGLVEVAGLDVILVHRMLKNHVPIAEYVSMTEPARALLSADAQGATTALVEDFEGLGTTPTHWLPLDALGAVEQRDLQPSAMGRALQWVGLTLRSLPYFIGAKTACEGFKELAPGNSGDTPHPGDGDDRA